MTDQRSRPTAHSVGGFYDFGSTLQRWAPGARGLWQECVAKRSIKPAVVRARHSAILWLIGDRFVITNAHFESGVVSNRASPNEAILVGNEAWDGSVQVHVQHRPPEGHQQ